MPLLDRLTHRRRDASAGTGAGPKAAGQDAFRLVVDYLKQETLDPLRGLGRYLAFGIAGSLLLAFGVLLLLIALLRLLQGETGTTFAGNLSWLPYAIVTVAALAIGALAAWRTTRGPAARRREATGGAGATGSTAAAGATGPGEKGNR